MSCFFSFCYIQCSHSQKVNDLIKKIVFVSKLTNIGRKIKNNFVIGLSNISIGLDILIIIIFSNLIIGETSYSNSFVKTSIEITY